MAGAYVPTWLLVYCLLSIFTPLTAAQLVDQTSGLPQSLGTTTACHLLAGTFRNRVLFPGEDKYSISQHRYWAAQQTELKPACRFYPRNARDVQQALADIIIPCNATIAVSSGGHSSNQGASNIDRGITFDLSQMNQVRMVPLAVEIGPGARWQDVYETLEQRHGLTMFGGRVGNVAAGGYILGGGFSWFANQYGWACDSVLKFQVVTPTAEVLWVDAKRHEDLFWALKGSLGAFGIVTKFEVKVIGNSPVYGGAMSYEARHFPRLCGALEEMALNAPNDLATQGYLSFAWVEAEKQFVYTAYLLNTEGKAKSKGIIAFESLPRVGGNLRTMNISESAKEIDKSNPSGLRRSKFTYTSKLDTKAMAAVHHIITRFAKGARFDDDSTLGVSLQPLTTPHIQASRETGGNIFTNLTAAHGPLLLISVELWWSSPSKDDHFDKATELLKRELEVKLTELGFFQDWIYPNYASRYQNPFKSLTPQTLKTLKNIKRKYDPDDRWRTVNPGIWHV
ncbi:FAD-dependent monooxygenase sdcF [Fulvia fulva]|uniref:FAD-dependent monooxygenase sdcF n=1 Tax=Passalora fulva TaxID=5499 RepID=A0A9Q8LJH6_PASFU|nr:FAD-dependent monooxygenase sdcF [Fulvia fulva]KAK4625469.1 FAD-dependent monooxygenase sdcF [Fulvia fulva]UJO18294.1 FAD-dependent monooxygenase sdcF [Fulvia fulva]